MERLPVGFLGEVRRRVMCDGRRCCQTKGWPSFEKKTPPRAYPLASVAPNQVGGGGVARGGEWDGKAWWLGGVSISLALCAQVG